MDQSGRLKRLAYRFLSHLLRGQSAKLIIDQGQQLVGSVGIALLDSR
jgi:hypothetical protein